MNGMHKEGFNFTFDPLTCKNCRGICCQGSPGYIWVNSKEIYQISEFLGINSIDFISKYLRKVSYRFSLIENMSEAGLSCIFFDRDAVKCSVYPVRPGQCRQYPFWDRFRTHIDELMAECPGVKKISE